MHKAASILAILGFLGMAACAVLWATSRGAPYDQLPENATFWQEMTPTPREAACWYAFLACAGLSVSSMFVALVTRPTGDSSFRLAKTDDASAETKATTQT